MSPAELQSSDDDVEEDGTWMTLGQEGVDTPARTLPPAPAAAVGADPYAVLAVRALCALISTVGALLLAIALVQRSFGPLTILAQSRLLMGLVLLGGGGLAYGLGRRGWQRLVGTLAAAVF